MLIFLAAVRNFSLIYRWCLSSCVIVCHCIHVCINLCGPSYMYSISPFTLGHVACLSVLIYLSELHHRTAFAPVTQQRMSVLNLPCLCLGTCTICILYLHLLDSLWEVNCWTYPWSVNLGCMNLISPMYATDMPKEQIVEVIDDIHLFHLHLSSAVYMLASPQISSNLSISSLFELMRYTIVHASWDPHSKPVVHQTQFNAW